MQALYDIHLNCVKGVLRYLSGTLNRHVFYKKNVSISTTRREHSCRLGHKCDGSHMNIWIRVFIGMWSNLMEQQEATINAMLSMEAKYRGAPPDVCEIIWMKRLLKDLNMKIDGSIHVNCDSLNSIQVVVHYF